MKAKEIDNYAVWVQRCTLPKVDITPFRLTQMNEQIDFW